jgi:hypothetical protein
MELHFGLFIQDAKGPLWQESFADEREAQRKAEELARTEGLESFVYNLTTYTEVARFFPASQRQGESMEQWHLPNDCR